MSAQEYLSADAAASYLGVSKQTLYAYVSRGLLHSEPGGDSRTRARRYSRVQLDRVRSQRDVRRGPGRGALRGGTPVLETGITERDPVAGTLLYRGRDAVELSRTASFEQVAALLWTGGTDGADALFAPAAPAGRAAARGRAAGAARTAATPSTRFAEAPGIADRLYACLVRERARQTLTLASGDAATLRAAAATVTALFDAAGARGDGPLATRLARGWGSLAAADDLRAALVLAADHGLATSTFTARCVASADAPVANVLLGALCALEGRRHGGHTPLAEQLVAAVEREGIGAAKRALARDGYLPGFWGGGYYDGDPRGRELLARVSPPRRDAVARLAALAAEHGLHPTVDLGLAAVARAHRLPRGSAFALFALGRSAGWIAHALEQAQTGALIRPRAVVTGPGQ